MWDHALQRTNATESAMLNLAQREEHGILKSPGGAGVGGPFRISRRRCAKKTSPNKRAYKVRHRTNTASEHNRGRCTSACSPESWKTLPKSTGSNCAQRKGRTLGAGENKKVFRSPAKPSRSSGDGATRVELPIVTPPGLLTCPDPSPPSGAEKQWHARATEGAGDSKRGERQWGRWCKRDVHLTVVVGTEAPPLDTRARPSSGAWMPLKLTMPPSPWSLFFFGPALTRGSLCCA